MHSGDPLERQKQDSHDHRKTGTLPLIFFKKTIDVTAQTIEFKKQ